jgi:hypothetical protein
VTTTRAAASSSADATREMTELEPDDASAGYGALLDGKIRRRVITYE